MRDFDLFLFENGPGTDNEKFLIDRIKARLRTNGFPTDIYFKSEDKEIKYEDIVGVIDCSRDTASRSKSDIYLVQLKDKKQINIPISIKSSNADYWESAQSYWGNQARIHIDALVESGKIKLTKKRDGYYEIDPQIAVKASEKESADVIFGSDILPLGCVIKNTFTENDFSFGKTSNSLQVNVQKIITSVNDVKGTEDEVWFFCRRDPGRNCVALGYNGIRILAACKRRIDTDSILKIEE